MRIYKALNAEEVRETFMMATKYIEEYYGFGSAFGPPEMIVQTSKIIEIADKMEEDDGSLILRGLLVYLRSEGIDCIFWTL